MAAFNRGAGPIRFVASGTGHPNLDPGGRIFIPFFGYNSVMRVRQFFLNECMRYGQFSIAACPLSSHCKAGDDLAFHVHRHGVDAVFLKFVQPLIILIGSVRSSATRGLRQTVRKHYQSSRLENFWNYGQSILGQLAASIEVSRAERIPTVESHMISSAHGADSLHRFGVPPPGH